ncbi:CAP domain-containing protein [Aliinostoc sp. HNIBRCY26]|uniref:CAP domain-containing protein n=1 Tax=Aliinostoc sp. HNIBRCY26 TaxID=3418997 RepID=UPI003D090F45
MELGIIRSTLLSVVSVTLISNSAIAFSAASPIVQFQQIAQSQIDTEAIEASVFQQVNQYRVSQKLPPLTRNAAIDNQARIHSQNMASGKVTFGHNGVEERLDAIAIPYNGAAENVADIDVRNSATLAVEKWLSSPRHKTNIEGNFNLSGVGVASNGSKIYVTQIFLESE